MRTPLLLLLLCLLFQGSALAQHFRWEPGTVKAVVRGPDVLEIGQYLYITHDRVDPEAWMMAKLNLPENWTVKEIKVQPAAIIVVTNVGSFQITPDNLESLREALLKTGPQTSDAEIEDIWKRQSKFKASAP